LQGIPPLRFHTTAFPIPYVLRGATFFRHSKIGLEAQQNILPAFRLPIEK
jgi:hypothetical protein